MKKVKGKFCGKGKKLCHCYMRNSDVNMKNKNKKYRIRSTNVPPKFMTSRVLHIYESNYISLRIFLEDLNIRSKR